MSQHNQQLKNTLGLFGAICGSLLVSLPAIAQVHITPRGDASANDNITSPGSRNQLTPNPPGSGLEHLQVSSLSPLNPCPSIFYEPRYYRVDNLLAGCPPRPVGTTSAIPVQPQTTLEMPQTITTVRPMNGIVDVRLVNRTNAQVTYQVIGDTAPRSLSGQSDVVLQALSTPITITFQRPDAGLLMVIAQPTSKPGVLEVTLMETTNPDTHRRAMTIGKNGNVSVN